MNIFEPNELFLFILFFVPGFVSMKIYDIRVPNSSRNSAAYIFEAVAYSTVNFAMTSFIWLPLFYSKTQHVLWMILAAITVLLIIPGLIGYGVVSLLASDFVRKHATGLISRPWDIVFNKKTGACVMVHLKSGRKVVGIYGDKSAISYHPYEEQIYLERVLNLDENGQLSSVPDSKGVIIMGNEISMIELFDAAED